MCSSFRFVISWKNDFSGPYGFEKLIIQVCAGAHLFTQSMSSCPQQWVEFYQHKASRDLFRTRLTSNICYYVLSMRKS